MSGHSDALVDYKASVPPKLEDNTHLRLQATSTIPAQSGLSIGVRSDWPGTAQHPLPKPCTRSSLPSGNSSTTAGSAASRRPHFPAHVLDQPARH